jgi:hypothetical protein
MNESLLTDFFSKSAHDLFAKGAGPQEVYRATVKSMGKFLPEGAAGLANERQRRLFGAAWSSHQAAEESRITSHIASQFRKYTGEVSERQKASTSDALGEIASQIETDWSNSDKYAEQGLVAIFSANAAGLSDADTEELAIGWEDYVNSSSVRGWFAASPNPLQSAQELASGKFSDPKVQERWDSLDPKQRKAVSSDLIGRAQKVAQLRNDQHEAARKQSKQNAAQQVSDFFMNDAPDQRAARIDIYDRMKNSPFVTQQTKNAMRDNLYGGVVVQDSEPGLVELEARIIDGTISTIADAMAFTYDGKQIATSRTMRSRIFPLISSTQDRAFSDSYSAGLAALGIVDTASETSTVLQKRAATFKQSFLAWKVTSAGRQDDPYKGDPWAAAMAISGKIKTSIKVDPAIMAMLRQMKQTYNSAVESNDAEAALVARKSMDGLLNLLELSVEDIK